MTYKQDEPANCKRCGVASTVGDLTERGDCPGSGAAKLACREREIEKLKAEVQRLTSALVEARDALMRSAESSRAGARLPTPLGPYRNCRCVDSAIQPGLYFNGVPVTTGGTYAFETHADRWLKGLAGGAEGRKQSPIFSGLLAYFKNACVYVAFVSKIGNEQHNAGQPMHWAFNKSTDHADCIARHLAEVGTIDDDGVRHAGKVAWRALAQLETELLRAYPELTPGANVKGFER